MAAALKIARPFRLRGKVFRPGDEAAFGLAQATADELAPLHSAGALTGGSVPRPGPAAPPERAPAPAATKANA